MYFIVLTATGKSTAHIKTKLYQFVDSRSVRIDIVMLRSIRFWLYSNRVITGPHYFYTNPSSTIAYLKGGQDMYEQGALVMVNVDKSAEVGGLDSLTLNSLYDEGAYKASQQPVYGSPAPNLFEAAGPFGMSARAGQ
ncbi:hypothetical protein Tco_1401235 [Tanacetum coccineum]